MIIEDDIDPIRIRFNKLAWTLDERMKRLFAAAEASALGRGGITRVAQATGVSRRAIHVGLQELSNLKEPVENAPKQVLEGTDHPDRNAQFEFISEQTTPQLMAGNPVISVATQKKELVGAFKNSGTKLSIACSRTLA